MHGMWNLHSCIPYSTGKRNIKVNKTAFSKKKNPKCQEVAMEVLLAKFGKL